jgi:ribosome-associated protein
LKKKIAPLSLAKQAANILWKIKCKGITILNIKKISTISDYFVIGTVESSTQMKAVIENLSKTFKDTGIERLYHASQNNIFSSPAWQILDYGSVVIHVMTQTAREFYSLEKMWHKAKKVAYK